MFKALLVYVKYPSVAGIIGAIWVGSGVLMVYDRALPVLTMVEINIAASFLIGLIGFRVDKK
ncbi:hypothetical protein HY087_00475 [Candidatus Gottesmanbacteria bacterium]|nr:hypothetical protein [Candidatus Gottesmanbacteria bacterium]MBI3559588.1 hypothetical protein [Candidatus Gottesmanbacteria bacterium]